MIQISSWIPPYFTGIFTLCRHPLSSEPCDVRRSASRPRPCAALWTFDRQSKWSSALNPSSASSRGSACVEDGSIYWLIGRYTFSLINANEPLSRVTERTSLVFFYFWFGLSALLPQAFNQAPDCDHSLCFSFYLLIFPPQHFKLQN